MQGGRRRLKKKMTEQKLLEIKTLGVKINRE